MDNKSERIVNIDILKGICAYLVVIIHYYFPIKHSYVEAIARMAVPVFFMISGYYCVGEWEEVKRKVVRLLSIFLMGEVIYFIYNLYEICMQWSQNGFSENNVISLIFNVEVFWVGWFLLALACMYVLFL